MVWPEGLEGQGQDFTLRQVGEPWEVLEQGRDVLSLVFQRAYRGARLGTGRGCHSCPGGDQGLTAGWWAMVRFWLPGAKGIC